MTASEPLARVVVADLNGVARGKMVAPREWAKVHDGAARMPLSALNVDIAGSDIDNSPLVFASGDRDGTIVPTERGEMPVPWAAPGARMMQGTLTVNEGAPFPGDPRHALTDELSRFGTAGWSVRVGLELEFYLLDPTVRPLAPPVPPGAPARLTGDAILSVASMDRFGAFFDALHTGAEAMAIPIASVSSEAGAGQYEIVLSHEDAMKSADDAFLLRLLVKGLARSHGMEATFLAKPFADSSGSGLHAHFSVFDRDGRNIFDDGSETGHARLGQAIAGCLEAFRASTLVFAPHPDSYDRFVEYAHAPTHAHWGYDNRTVALRVPGGSPKARRFEHRAAGADANPYLVLAAILGAAINGMEAATQPPPPVTGDAFRLVGESLAPSLADALAAFDAAPVLPESIARNLLMTKRQELERFASIDADTLLGIYLETI